MLKFKQELSEGLLRFVNFLLRIFASSRAEKVYIFVEFVYELQNLIKSCVKC